MKDNNNIGDISLIQDLVARELGIVVKGEKRTTLLNRASRRLEILELGTFKEYCDFILSDPSREELYVLATDITNKETYFFREREQLDVFSGLLPDIKARKQTAGINRLKVLSLGSSTGEEAYTLNILIQESGLFVVDWDISVIGVDIDREAIRKACKASYTVNSFRTLNGDSGSVTKYFIRDRDRYVLRERLTRNVGFRHGNLLLRQTVEGLTGADVIFCRNVLIYMCDEAVRKIAENLYYSLSDTGYLFVGASESLIRKTELFSPENLNGVIVYRKILKKETRSR